MTSREGSLGSPAQQDHPRGRYAAYAQSAMPVGIVSVKLYNVAEVKYDYI